MVSYARKYDVSENLNHYRLDRIRYKMRENISTRNGHIGLDARKFSCAKIYTFTVYHTDRGLGGRGPKSSVKIRPGSHVALSLNSYLVSIVYFIFFFFICLFILKSLVT